MSVVRLISDAEASERVAAVFADMRATRRSDFVNNFWRALATDPALLESTWREVKAVMSGPGPLDPKLREMIFVAASAATGCRYCVHSHTAAARAKGMTETEHGQLLAIIGLAAKTNRLAEALQVPVDPELDAGSGG